MTALARNMLGRSFAGAGGRVIPTGTRRPGLSRVLTLMTRRRLRRWFGWALVAVGVIGLVHPGLPGVVPPLIGVALLQGGSGRVRRLLRRVDERWQGARRNMIERTFLLGLHTEFLPLAEEALVGEAGMVMTRWSVLIA